MEVKTFKIRLSFYNSDEKTIYIDELEDKSGLTGLSCEFNWIEVGSGYSKNSDGYNRRQKYNRIERGFTDDDVTMDVEYNDNGYLDCTLIAADSFDKKVTVCRNDTLITRKLIDWVKIDINGSLSDGVGENPVANFYSFDNPTNEEVWMSEIITDEATDKEGYFTIPEPIKVVKDAELVKSLYKPDYVENNAKLVQMYKDCFENGKVILDKSKTCSMIMHDIETLRNNNIAYMIKQLDK